MTSRFLWRPTWVHVEQPTSGLLGLPRLKWLVWVPDRRSIEQRIATEQRNAIGAAVFAIGAAVTALVLVASGCWC